MLWEYKYTKNRDSLEIQFKTIVVVCLNLNLIYQKNSRQPDSNWRPFTYEANALTTLLCRLISVFLLQILNPLYTQQFSLSNLLLSPYYPYSVFTPNKLFKLLRFRTKVLPINVNIEDTKRLKTRNILLNCLHAIIWSIFQISLKLGNIFNIIK